jgi:hypothetical protein
MSPTCGGRDSNSPGLYFCRANIQNFNTSQKDETGGFIHIFGPTQQLDTNRLVLSRTLSAVAIARFIFG